MPLRLQINADPAVIERITVLSSTPLASHCSIGLRQASWPPRELAPSGSLPITGLGFTEKSASHTQRAGTEGSEQADPSNLQSSEGSWRGVGPPLTNSGSSSLGGLDLGDLREHDWLRGAFAACNYVRLAVCLVDSVASGA